MQERVMDRVSYVNSNTLIRLYTVVMSTWTELYKAPQVPPWSDCDSNQCSKANVTEHSKRQAEDSDTPILLYSNPVLCCWIDYQTFS